MTGNKYQANSYMGPGHYGHQANIRQEKRQGYDQQDIAQELCNAMLQQTHQDKQNNDKVIFLNSPKFGNNVPFFGTKLTIT